MAESPAAGAHRRATSLRAHWRNLSLRARLTSLTMAVLAVALIAAVLLLIAAQTHSLTRNLDTGARRTAEQVSSYVASGGRLPDPLPIGDGNTVVVQLVSADGKVIAASATADRLVPLLSAAERARVRSGQVLVISGDRAGVNGVLRVVGQATGLGDTSETVFVAVYADQITESARALRDGLLIAAPVLLAVASLLCWYVVGRALRPVEDLRRGAEEITGTGSARAPSPRQLPVPAANDEIHRLAVTLNDMLVRLDAASAKQRGFIADAAHELRSPLASLRTQLEVGVRLGPNADWSSTVDGSLLDIERLTRLVDDLLLLARLDEQPRTRRRQLVPLAPLINDLVDSYVVAGAPGIDVAASQPNASAEVVADPDAVRRLLRNLLDNAVRHAATEVRVAVSESGGDAVVTVSDDGPGIAASDRARVFDRFTRLDAARSRDAGGSGLGLPIVRELVHASGGSVTLEDARPGRANPGLRVVVRLPAAADLPVTASP